MSISTPFRVFSTHCFLHPSKIPILKTLKISSLPPTRLFSSKPITIERLSGNPIFAIPPTASATTSPSSLQPVEELPPKLQEIVKLFQAVQEPKAKYEQLLFYGRNLKPLDDKFKTGENKVQGCVSQVWVRAYLDQDRNVIFEADSDSVLTKGLAALLVQGLSGRPVGDILGVSPDFVVLLGLQQSLTPSRNNGFLNMLKLMQKKALHLYVEAEKSKETEQQELRTPGEIPNSSLEGERGSGNLKSEMISGGAATGEQSDFDAGDALGSRGKRMKEKLERELKPVLLEIEDISYQHAGHAGAKGSDGETHFNLKVVSQEFEGKSLVKRHRLIYDLLQDELQSGLHALSIVAKTPSEVENS